MIRIYGSSDDLVEIEGGGHDDEIGAYDKPRCIEITNAEGHGVRVVAEYAPGSVGVWRMAVEQIDEDVPIPWPIRVVTEHGYSVAVVIDCPDDVTVMHDGPKDDE
jgi:hypothetical protein